MQLLRRASLCVVLCALGSYAQTQTTQPAAAPRIAFEKFTLSNGLQVILHVDRKLPMVHVNIWYHVGSKNERVGRSGFAHLFEHMMFEGSKNASKKYFVYAEQAGANLLEGGVNGTTNWDRTNYFITVPSANLENVLWLESDRMATLADAITKERFENQREVVRNERRQGLENVPYGRWIKLISENLFPYRHPYANDVIGSHEDLQAATVEDVRDFFHTYYTPNNASLAIVGDIDPVAARKLVEKYFGGIPAGVALDRPPRSLPALEGEKVIEVRDRVPQERTYFAWVTPAYFEAGDAELDLIAGILTDGLASRLSKVLVYEKRLCSDVNAFQFSREAAGGFVVRATARPGAALPEVERIITEEIARLAREGPTEAELDRAKTKWEYGFVSGLERIGGFGGKADRLNEYNTFLGDPGRFDADLARHRNPSAADIRDVATRWLNTPNRLIVRFHPEPSGRPMETALDRGKQPELGADRPFQAPEVQSARLENGLQVFVITRSDLPKVAVGLWTRAGSADDTAARAGVADLTASTLRMGTKTRKALEIEDAMGDLGSSLASGAGRESSQLGFEVLKRNLAPAVAIFADVALNPSFPASEVDLQKKRRLDALAQESKNPNGIGFRVAAMLSYGADHPYGTPARGLPGTVEKLTREDLVQFHATYWKPASSALIFAGDVSLEEALALARQHFGSWAGGARPARAIPAPRPYGPGKVFLIDRQDAPQTMIMQILPAPRRQSDEYYALQLADAVWGGAATARLGENLREQKGYSYGVFSSPTLYSEAGAWMAYGAVQADKTKESVIEFVKELAFLAGEKPATAEELAKAKANRIRGYAQQFESMRRVADQVGSLWTLGLPMSELQREPAELGGTALEAVNAVARKYAVPQNSMLLLVGDLSKLEPAVRGTVQGEMVVLDVEGRPVKK
ncbi:MAG: pitrilysin family protein [Bryobacteraceae bacterium]|jgi:zinc protease